MAKFYGNLRGSRGEATRCGTSGSGLLTAARSWDGSIIVELSETDSGTWARISASTGSTARPEATLWEGRISDLVADDVTLRIVNG